MSWIKKGRLNIILRRPLMIGYDLFQDHFLRCREFTGLEPVHINSFIHVFGIYVQHILAGLSLAFVNNSYNSSLQVINSERNMYLFRNSISNRCSIIKRIRTVLFQAKVFNYGQRGSADRVAGC